MEEEFLAKNNPCGQTLLELVSRGNVIIAELLRLKDHIPAIFKLETKQDVQKYGEILLDFGYFNSPEVVEQKIENSLTLRELSEEIREYYGDILIRFYNAYESVYKYISDLNTFIEELEEGVYIQQTMDTVFLSEDGMQLMCESVYLYGVMLFILDLYHIGPVRERLIVSYSRYNITVVMLDQVCKLMRCSGFINGTNNKRPQNYPQDLFKRIPVNEKLVSVIIGKLRTDDIYHQQKALPLPQHKTTALAQQSAILFVVLFFASNILHNQTSRMREIVDKYFPDNWIVNIYMGITINLIDIWEPFKAARTALANTLETVNIQECASMYRKDLNRLLVETDEMLMEGKLTKSFLMDNVSKIVSLARECNVTLRWLMLHRAQRVTFVETLKKCKTVRDEVISMVNHSDSKILQLLLNTAQFEVIICNMFKTVLDQRSDEWSEGKKESLIRINELSEVFSGSKHIMRVKKNDSLKKWFDGIAEQIETLSLDEPNISARKIAQLIEALEEVQVFQQMTRNLGVKQLATETCSLLRNMLAAVNIRDTLYVHMQIIGDFSYGWLVIDNYTHLIQLRIKQNPSLVHKLRAMFLKLSSAMETSLLRINQAEDKNLPSVSQYYSNQLVKYARNLLQVIPREMFQIMSEITKIQTTQIPDLPTRMEKDKIKEFAQLEERFHVSRLTNEVSVFSTGLLNMPNTLVGIVCVEPKQLLEEGIRKELFLHINKAFETGLTFSSKLKSSDLVLKLEELGMVMQGHKNSFEYIQDYMGINGVKMWQEEFKRVINSKLEDDCRLLRTKSANLDLQTISFIGRLCKHIIEITDPKVTFFSEQDTLWLDRKTKAKIIDLKFFKTLMKAIGVPGLVAVNKIICFIITKQLQNLVNFLSKEASNNKAWSDIFGNLSKSLSPCSLIIDQPAKFYPNSVNKLQKLFSAGLFDTLISVGQLQLLRKQICFTLNHTAKIHARNYTSSLSVLNDGLLFEVKQHLRDPKLFCPPSEELMKLAPLLDSVGLSDPYMQIYITTKGLPYMGLLLFLFTSSFMSKFSLDKTTGNMTCKKTGEGLTPFTIGLQTLLRQFHPQVTDHYITYACQYIKSHMFTISINSKPEIPQEALSMLQFLEDLVEYIGCGRNSIAQHIPLVIVNLFGRSIAAYTDS
ncbi:WASH complex subunit 5 [Cimex lectularius]|uniref:WASH complex subunit strumpellin n=1 Tax=Cimex lectularius TaxID=79782 RepID=A0A8I6RB87_CIMLE|nr:WASH complex subunit 5 [Cimex lectularius]